ncbi:hypothetical protein ScPMuIL_002007 [Solemya velum]
MSSYTKRIIAKKILRSLKNRIFIEKDAVLVTEHLASSISLRDVSKKTDISGPQFQLKFREARKHFTEAFVKNLKEVTPQNLETESDVESVAVEDVRQDDKAVLFRVNADLLSKSVLESIRVEGDRYGYQLQGGSAPRHTTLVEYSSPNIAKPFHAGHLRSTIIGNVIANLFERVGHNVVRINYLGDWGTQFGLLAVGFHRYGNQQELQTNPMLHLFQVYVKINGDVEKEKGPKQRETESATYQEGLEAFKKMEEGNLVINSDLLSLWTQFREISIQEYSKVYKRLGIHFTEYQGEAMFQDKSRALIDTLGERGLLQYNSEDGFGYVEVETAGQNNRAALVKSDGSTLYLTRDVAAALHRLDKYKFDSMYYVVDAGQILHFRHLIGVLRRLSVPWADTSPADIHVGFGRVEGMSTRRGQVVFLEDILNEAKQRMLDTMRTKETTKDLETVDVVADILGISAIIVQDLRERRQKNYKFSWDKVLSFKSDSGVSLQYAHARLCSVERNCGVTLTTEIDPAHLSDREGQLLLLHIARYEEVVSDALRTLEPYHIVQYLFTLGHLINSAHRNLKVKGQPEEVAKARLLLFNCAKTTLANGLTVLGISPLQQM